MTTTLLLVTHGLAVAIGVLTGRALTLKAARTWPDPPHLLEDVMHHHDHTGETPAEGNARRSLRDSARLSATLLLAGLFVVVIGAQAYLQQRDDARDDARLAEAISELEDTTSCIRDWGERFADVTTTRTGGSMRAGTVDLEKAAQRRDTALDQIVLTVIAARRIPPLADVEDFDRVLREYAASIRNRDKVQRDVDVTRDLNPYPDLECTSATP